LFTVALHELGHTLGMNHSLVPGAIMYSYYMGTKAGLGADDVAGIRSIYSAGLGRTPDVYDAVLPNDIFATATSLTPLIDPGSLTAVADTLDITTTSDVDFYSLVVPPTAGGTLTVTAQSSGLSLLAPTLTVYAADQTTVLASVSGA